MRAYLHLAAQEEEQEDRPLWGGGEAVQPVSREFSPSPRRPTDFGLLSLLSSHFSFLRSAGFYNAHAHYSKLHIIGVSLQLVIVSYGSPLIRNIGDAQ